MRLADYPTKDGKRVWLTQSEIEQLIEQTDNPTERLALTLGGKGGLRREEIVSVTANDFYHAPNGFVRVWGNYAKRDKYRETPIPENLQSLVRGITQAREDCKPVVYNEGWNKAYDSSSVYRWLKKAAKRMQAKTDDEGWGYLDVHDLRRSWGGHLLWNCGLSPMSVMDFGGWEDWSTFQEHYMGEMTPEARDRERSKIDYLGGEPKEKEQVFQPKTPATKATYKQ